jgi:3-oxoadipate enol-lactonase
VTTATINDTSINYTDTGGDGRPVVLLHAFPLNSGQWEEQIDALSGRYRFVVPDLKGFGGSDAPEDAASYSMDDYADSVAGLLDELGLQKVTLVGLSMGGYIAFAFLRRHRDLVDSLVLADTRAEADPPEGKEKRSKQQGMVRSEGTSGLIDALSGALIAEATLNGKPDVVDRLRKLMDNPPAGFVGALEAMKNRPDSSGELSAIDVPTLVIVGEKDGVTPPDAARTIHDGVSGSEMVVIPDVGHLSNLEAPEDFTAAVEKFLSKL